MTHDGSALYAATSRGVYRSTNLGDLWTPANGGLTDTLTFALFSHGGRILLGASHSAFQSSDAGSSWTPMTSGMPGGRVYSFAAVGSTDIAATSNGVYRSTNAGIDWIPAGTGISGDRGTPLALRALNNVVVLTTSLSGCYLSTDAGENWNEISEGLTGPGSGLNSLAESNGYLFGGSYNGGVWRRPLSDILTGIRGKDNTAPGGEYALEQNFPNPFNPSTKIRYYLERDTEIELAVFDLLGRRVMTLVKGREEAGDHEVNLSGQGLASGVYYYRLRAGTKAATRSCLLVR
jgi:hypothetical protein